MRQLRWFLAMLLAGTAVLSGQLPAPASAGPQCAPSAGDAARAAAMAKACQARVEIGDAGDEYTRVFAEPPGHRTAEISVTPQRAKGPDGRWGPVDTGLRRVPEGIRPAATAADVVFSAGGDGPFVTLSHGGHSFSLSWPDPLPPPVVVADSATYPGVLPGVDLVVRARPAGFSHYLIVHTASAAKNPRVRQAKYRVGGDAELAGTPEGGLVARAKGTVVATAGEAMMWDGGKQKTAKVAAVPDRGELLLTPDTTLLDDATASFPIVVDPSFDTGQNRWTYATSNNSTGTTKDSKIGPGDPDPAATVVTVGLEPDYVGRRYRGFLQFPIASLAGKQVLSAQIDGKTDHTWKCTDNRPSYLYRASAISTTPRQSWPGPTLLKRIASISVHANEGACAEANDPFEATSATFESDMQTALDKGWSTYTVGVSAADTVDGDNESATERYMRFFLSNYKLRITYNTRPGTPDTLTVDGKPCADKPFVKTATPALRAHVTDSDNNSLDVSFWWSKWNGTSYVDEPGAGAAQANVPNNGTALMNITAGADGGRYAFRAQSKDDHLSSAVTPNCEWTVDLTPPEVPTVQAAGHHAEGVAGSFTFSSSPDTTTYLWGLSDPPTKVATPATLGGSVTVDWTPTSAGPKTLRVKAIDRAGNESLRLYPFSVEQPAPAVARWKMNHPAGTVTLPDDTGSGHTATIHNGATFGAPGLLIPGNDGVPRTALALDGVDDRVVSDGRVIADTGRNFTVAAWVKVDDLSADRTVWSLNGTHNPVLQLIATSTGTWRLVSTVSDATPPVFNPPMDFGSTARAGVWTHVVVSYDSATHRLNLGVNDTMSANGIDVTLWNGDGVLRLGEGMPGSFGEVNVWERTGTYLETSALYDPLRVAKAGEWRMEEIGPGPAYDSSGMLRDLTFFGGAQVPPAGAGQSGTGLRLDGADDYATHAAQVLRTDQSFTVSAWARLASTDRAQAILAQESDRADPGFALWYSPDGGGRWNFRAHGDVTAVAAAPTPTSYHHLVAVFDAQKRELRLYLDGGTPVVAPVSAAWSGWSATGRLLIGRSQAGAAPTMFAHADLDEVRVYQGVVANVTRIP
ncbi:MAG TPA: LamG domain-containing protein [Candidatus Limnocylindrales bacterium]